MRLESASHVKRISWVLGRRCGDGMTCSERKEHVGSALKWFIIYREMHMEGVQETLTGSLPFAACGWEARGEFDSLR